MSKYLGLNVSLYIIPLAQKRLIHSNSAAISTADKPCLMLFFINKPYQKIGNAWSASFQNLGDFFILLLHEKCNFLFSIRLNLKYEFQ